MKTLLISLPHKPDLLRTGSSGKNRCSSTRVMHVMVRARSGMDSRPSSSTTAAHPRQNNQSSENRAGHRSIRSTPRNKSLDRKFCCRRGWGHNPGDRLRSFRSHAALFHRLATTARESPGLKQSRRGGGWLQRRHGRSGGAARVGGLANRAGRDTPPPASDRRRNLRRPPGRERRPAGGTAASPRVRAPVRLFERCPSTHTLAASASGALVRVPFPPPPPPLLPPPPPQP